jgi:hypothetical protein
VGVQFEGVVAAGATSTWFTFNWPENWHVLWTVVPTLAAPGGAKIKFDVRVERGSDAFITYWIQIQNIGGVACPIQARYAVFGW